MKFAEMKVHQYELIFFNIKCYCWKDVIGAFFLLNERFSCCFFFHPLIIQFSLNSVFLVFIIFKIVFLFRTIDRVMN